MAANDSRASRSCQAKSSNTGQIIWRGLRLVDRLEAEGLLRRERSGEDRRGAYAVLTEQGHAALRQAWPVYARGIATHFAQHLDAVEVRTLTEALHRVLNAARDG